VLVLMRASFIIVLDVFCDYTWRIFKSSLIFPDWLTFMSSSNDGLSFLFALLSCSFHNMDLLFYQIGLSSVFPPLSQHKWIKKERNSTNELNKAHMLIEMHSRWLPHEAGWENAKSVQSCHQGKCWLLWRISNIKYILICLTLLGLLHDPMCVIS
jgi:hypothetical protein